MATTTTTEEDLRAFYRGTKKRAPDDTSLEDDLRAYYRGERPPAPPAPPAPPPPPPPDPSSLSGAVANLKNLPKLITEGIPRAVSTAIEHAGSPARTLGENLAFREPAVSSTSDIIRDRPAARTERTALGYTPIPAALDLGERFLRTVGGVFSGAAELGPEKAKPLTEALLGVATGGPGARGMAAQAMGAATPDVATAVRGLRKPPPPPPPKPMLALPETTSGARPMGPTVDNAAPLGPPTPRPRNARPPVAPKYPTPERIDEIVSEYMGGAPKRPAGPDRPPLIEGEGPTAPPGRLVDAEGKPIRGRRPARKVDVGLPTPPGTTLKAPRPAVADLLDAEGNVINAPSRAVDLGPPAPSGAVRDAQGRLVVEPPPGATGTREKLRSMYKGREPERIDLTGAPPEPLPDWFDPSRLPPRRPEPPAPPEMPPGMPPPPPPGSPSPSGRPAADPGVFGIEMDKPGAPMPPPAKGPTPNPELALRDYAAPGGTKVYQQIGNELVEWTKTDRNEWQGWVAGAHRKLTGESALNLAANPPPRVGPPPAPEIQANQLAAPPAAKLVTPSPLTPPPLGERLPVNPRALPVAPKPEPPAAPAPREITSDPQLQARLERAQNKYDAALEAGDDYESRMWSEELNTVHARIDEAKRSAEAERVNARAPRVTPQVPGVRPDEPLPPMAAPERPPSPVQPPPPGAPSVGGVPGGRGRGPALADAPAAGRFEGSGQGLIGGTPEPTMPTGGLKAPVAQGERSLADFEADVARLDKSLRDMGPEPPKPSNEARRFGNRGRAGADPAEVARYDAEVKAHAAWQRRSLFLRKQKTAADNALYEAKSQQGIFGPSKAAREAEVEAGQGDLAGEGASARIRSAREGPVEPGSPAAMGGLVEGMPQGMRSGQSMSEWVMEQVGPDMEAVLAKTKNRFALPDDVKARLRELDIDAAGAMAAARKRAAAAELGATVEGLPPVEPGFVRLYRGEAPPGSGKGSPDWVKQGAEESGQADASGRWFTQDPGNADWYVKDAGDKGRLVYVDVPEDIARRSHLAGLPEGHPARKFSIDPENEHFIPRVWADKKQPVAGGLPPVKVGDAVNTPQGTGVVEKIAGDSAAVKLDAGGKRVKANVEDLVASNEPALEAPKPLEMVNTFTPDVAPPPSPPRPEAPKPTADALAAARERRVAAEARVDAAITRVREAWNEGGTASGKNEPPPPGNLRLDPEYRAARAELSQANAAERQALKDAEKKGVGKARAQKRGLWEDTGSPDLNNPKHVAALVHGYGKIKDTGDVAGELRNVPAYYKSKNGLSPEQMAQAILEDYPHLMGGDVAAVRDQVLDVLSRDKALLRDQAARAAKAARAFDVTGQVPGRQVSGGPPLSKADANFQKSLEWWENIGGESGALRLPNVTPITQGAGRIADDIKKLFAPAARGPEAQQMAGIVREHAAELAAKTARAEKELARGALLFEKLPDAARYRFIDALESGRPSKPGSTAETLRRLLEERRVEVQRLGVGALQNYIEHYFPHIWKRSDHAENVLGQMLGKRPLEGSKAFLRQRTIPTTAEGVAAGLEPVSTNPVTLTLLKLREMDKFIMGQRVFKEMKDTGLTKFVKLGDRGPSGWAKVNDKVARVLVPTPEGMVLRGEYYAPEPAARVLNNYLSPGLHGNAIYDAFRGVGNSMNQAQLGLSAFHLAFVSYDSMISKAAVGLQQVFGGQVLRGLGNIAHGSSPVAPFTTFLKGNKVLKEYFSPGSQGAEMAAAVDQLIKGGGRVQMDKFYKNSSMANFRTALHEGRYLAAAARSPWALLEATAWPLMEYIVPRMKLGAFADLAKFELGRLPAGASREQVRAALGGAWDSIDNRLGQMVYDNLFWDKTVKDLGMVGTRSLGWNLGTLREIGGGAGADLPAALRGGRGLTSRMAYTMTLPMLTAFYGGIMHYLGTGKGPSELTDYFFPKTGATRPGGTDDRLSLPTYMRDVFAYASHPVDTVKHKIHPLLSTIWEMLENRDFYGKEIRNPDDPLVQRWIDNAEHVAGAFVPFSARGFGAGPQASPSTLGAVAGVLGHTPAPVAMTRTAEEQAAIERRGNRAAHRKKERADALPSAMERFREYIK